MSRVRLILVLLVLSMPSAPAEMRGSGESMTQADLATLRENLRPIDFGAAPAPSGAVLRYYERYGLNPAGHRHAFGTFRSGGHVLSAHAFQPATPRGTVILMHGFLDHTGTLGATVRHLLSRELAVAAYDMPGHGLSSGPRASIRDFEEYTRALDAFLRLCRAHLPAPYHVLAHSTGASALVTHLLTRPDKDLRGIVLVAPLVRSVHWHLSTIGADLLAPFIDNVPRVFRDNTSDPAFATFVRQDPLQPRYVALDWIRALDRWNSRIDGMPPSPSSVIIIQGDADSVVDWRYNIPLLRKKFPNVRVEMIHGGRHQLLGERRALRDQVLRIVDEVFVEQPED